MKHPKNQSTKEPLETPQRLPTFSEALAQEMALTAETLNEPLSELKVAGYLEALRSLRVEQIRMGFRRARKTLKYFPKPVEVRELSQLEAAEMQPTHRLEEAVPEWTPEQKKTWMEAMSKVAKKIGAAQPSDEELVKRRNDQLEKFKASEQAKQVAAKYKAKGA